MSTVKKRIPGLMWLSPRLTAFGLLLIFVAGVMCFCGVPGYRHTVASLPIAEATDAHLSAVQDNFSDERSPEGDDLSGAAYAATFLVLSFGVALGVLLYRRRRWRAATVARFSLYPLLPATLARPYAPVRSRLQVFLL